MDPRDFNTRNNVDVVAKDNTVMEWIIANSLNPEATQCLLTCSPDVQLKVIMRGSCDPKKVRDQTAVVKKRIMDISRGVATGIYCREVEDFIKNHDFDEKAKDVLRTSAPQVQRIVLDRGPVGNEAKNPSAVILVRARDAQRAAAGTYMDGRGGGAPGRILGMPSGHYGSLPYGVRDAPPVDRGEKRPPQPMTAAEMESEAGVPVVTWLSFGPTSALVRAGFSEDAPAITYTKTINLFHSGHSILEELLKDVEDPNSLQVEHDEEWKKFPGIGEAYKAECGEENCFAVATSQEHGKWACGFHAGRKGRELASKLALAVAVVSGSKDEERISRLFPDFAILLDEAAIGRESVKRQKLDGAAFTQTMQAPPPTPRPQAQQTPGIVEAAAGIEAARIGQFATSKEASMASSAAAAQAAIFGLAPGPIGAAAAAASAAAAPPMMAPPPMMTMESMAQAQQTFAQVATFGLVGAPTPGMAAAAAGMAAPAPGMAPGMAEAPAPAQSLPTPPVNSISIPMSSPILTQGYAPEAPAVVFDKQYNENFFSQSGYFIKSLVGEAMQIEIQHDDDWRKYPEIGKSLKPSGLQENSFAVAMCPDLGKWALGVGGNWKNREGAAKLALCMAIAMDTPHFHQTLINFPNFHQMCVNVGLVPSGLFGSM